MKVKNNNFYLKAALLLVLMVGMYLRVGAVLNTEIDTPIRADARLYYLYGLNLKIHHVFSNAMPEEARAPDAFAPPLYPVAIAPFLEFPPSDRMLVNIGLAQAILGTLTILFAFWLFWMLGGSFAGLAAAGLTAISPHLISMTVYMLTETLFTFFMIGGLAALTYSLVKNSACGALGAGIMIGLAALTRSTLEYFPLFIFLAGWALAYFQRMDRAQFRRVLQFAATAFTVVMVWKIRNLIMTGEFSDPTLIISTLHHGMYPDFMFEGRPESRGIPYRFDPHTAEITANLSNVLNEIAHRFYKEPWQHLQWYLLGKPISLLSWSDAAGWGDIFVYAPISSPYFSSILFQWTRALMLHTHAYLMLLGSLSVLLLLFKPRVMGLARAPMVASTVVALLIVYFILLHIVGAPFPRYGIPLRPVMYGLAVMGIFSLARRLRAMHHETN